jgi:hypothetical protein
LQGRRPPFQIKKVTVGTEDLELYYRDIMQSIQALYGDPQLAEHLVFAPERHYTSHERTDRIYNEMHTGDWWWAVQVCEQNYNHLKVASNIVLGLIGESPTRRYHHTTNHID